MNRRSFLSAMLATCAAPAIVRASSLMPVAPQIIVGYGLPPPGELIRVFQWANGMYGMTGVIGKYFDKPEPVGYTSPWQCGIYIAPELNIKPANVTSIGFLANTPSGLLVADPKNIVSWERVSPA